MAKEENIKLTEKQKIFCREYIYEWYVFSDYKIKEVKLIIDSYNE